VSCATVRSAKTATHSNCLTVFLIFLSEKNICGSKLHTCTAGLEVRSLFGDSWLVLFVDKMSQAHDLTTTQEFVGRMLTGDVTVATSSESGHNTLLAVADNVDRLLKQITYVINQRQSLCYEKEKCLKWVFPRFNGTLKQFIRVLNSRFDIILARSGRTDGRTDGHDNVIMTIIAVTALTAKHSCAMLTHCKNVKLNQITSVSFILFSIISVCCGYIII